MSAISKKRLAKQEVEMCKQWRLTHMPAIRSLPLPLPQLAEYMFDTEAAMVSTVCCVASAARCAKHVDATCLRQV